jgi:hypothetical protein
MGRSLRQISSSSARAVQKDDIYRDEKDELNPRYDEHSKTGGDDVVADQAMAAYSREHLTPEAAKERAGKGIEINPLEVSPASREVSFFVEETLGIGNPKLKSERKSAVKAKVVKIIAPESMPKGKDDKEWNKLYREVHKAKQEKE